ncbi:MAG TPA: sucrase ferredoxin [Sporichthyaceae bacterium]
MTTDPLPPCREVSLDLAEPLAASATTAVSWLLVEHPGPWPAKAPRGVRWPDGLGDELEAVAKRAGVRVGLIRRPAASLRPGVAGDETWDETRRETRVLFAHTGPDHARAHRLALGDPRELLDLDLTGLAAGQVPEPAEDPGRVFLVCTHGSRDACCALTGRAVAAALAARFPTRTWECTHLGGHRFAPTMACFPHGLMYGRLSPDDALEVAEAYREDRIIPAFYRGRTCLTAPGQAAEAWLRARLDRWEIDAVRPVAERALDDSIEVELAVTAGPTWRLQVAGAPAAESRRISCRETEPESPTTYRVIAAAHVAHS